MTGATGRLGYSQWTMIHEEWRRVVEEWGWAVMLLAAGNKREEVTN